MHLRLVCKAVEAHIKYLLKLFSFNQCTILNFQTPFFETSDISIFWLDSIKNLYANSKRVEVFWYEVSCGYAALIKIYDLSKVVPFFWTTRYTFCTCQHMNSSI